MKPDTIQDSTRVVVSDIRHGSILPGSRAEMWRDLFLLPGADVRGAAWGNRLTIEGPGVSLADSVYVRGEVTVTESVDAGTTPPANATPVYGDVTLGGCVTTPDSVLVDATKFRTRFLSHIYAGIVNLRNVVVHGSVYARSGVIRDSLIIGGVFCRETLTLENCIVATFRARTAHVGRGVRLFFPIAAAEQPLVLKHPVHTLSFLPLEADAAPPAIAGGAVTLDASDVYRVPTSADGASTSTGRAPAELHVLSADERLLDGDPVMASLSRNRRLLEGLSVMRHLDPRAQERDWDTDARHIEDELMAMVARDQLPELHGRTRLADLLRRPAIADAIGDASDVLRDADRDGAIDGAPPADRAETALRRHALPPEIADLFDERAPVTAPVPRLDPPRWPEPAPRGD